MNKLEAMQAAMERGFTSTDVLGGMSGKEKEIQTLRDRGLSDDAILAGVMQQLADSSDNLRGRANMATPEQQMDHGLHMEALKYPAQRTAERELGEPVDPKSGLSFGQRFNYGWADTPAEVQNKFKKDYPEGELSNLGGVMVYREKPDGPARMLDEPEATMGDVADMSGLLPVVGAQIPAAMLSSGASIPAQAAYIAGAGLLGALGKEGVEELRGDQLEPWSEVMSREAGNAVLDLGGGLLGGSLTRPVNRLRGANRTQVQADDIRALKYLLKKQDLEPPLAGQLSPNPITQGLQNQAQATSPVLQDALKRQQESAVRFTQGLDTRTTEGTGRDFIRRGLSLRDKQIDEAIRPVPRIGDPETVGSVIQDVAGKEWYEKSRKAVTAQYDRVRRLAQKEDLRFDLTEAKDLAQGAKVPGIVDKEVDGLIQNMKGQPITTETIQEFINVAPTLRGNRVARLLSELSPEQMNWDAIQQLKNGLSKAWDVSPTASPDEKWLAGQQKGIWKALDSAQKNAEGASNAYKTASNAASREAKRRFEVLDNSAWRKIYDNDDPRALGELFSKPGAFTPEARRALVEHTKPEKIEAIRHQFSHNLLTDDRGPRAAMEEFAKRDPRTLDFFLPRKGPERTLFNDAMANVEKIRGANVYNVLSREKDGLNAAENALYAPGVTTGQVSNMIQQAGGHGSNIHEGFKKALISRIIRKSLGTDKEGLPTLSIKAYNDAVQEAKERGFYRLLMTTGDKRDLNGLMAYSRLILSSLSDVGTSLQKQEILSGLKMAPFKPAAGLSALHRLTVNNVVLTNLFQNKTWMKKLLHDRAVPAKLKTAPWVMAGATASVVGRLHSDQAGLYGSGPSELEPTGEGPVPQ